MEFRNDGVSLVTGSYRVEECIEVWDLRMYKRSRVIPWEGSGSQEVLMYDDETGIDLDEPFTDNEESKSSRPQSVFGTMPVGTLKRDTDSIS
jgi:hypothetical protein